MLEFRPTDQDVLPILASWFADAELRKRIRPPDPRWFYDVTHKPNVFGWMIFDGSRALGHFYLDTLPDHSGDITLVVNPSLRGQGYGTILLRAFLRHSAVRELNTLTAWIWSDNIPARCCFERCGFAARNPGETGLLVYNYTRPALPEY